MIEKELEVIKILNQTKFKLFPLSYQYYDEYSCFDCQSRYEIVELKHRDFDLNKYNTYILEKSKFNRVLREAFNSRKKFWYVNSFDSGEIIGWNISHMYLFKNMPPLSKITCPTTTEFANNEKIEKDVYLLSLDTSEYIGKLEKSI